MPSYFLMEEKALRVDFCVQKMSNLCPKRYECGMKDFYQKKARYCGQNNLNSSFGTLPSIIKYGMFVFNTQFSTVLLD